MKYDPDDMFKEQKPEGEDGESTTIFVVLSILLLLYILAQHL